MAFLQGPGDTEPDVVVLVRGVVVVAVRGAQVVVVVVVVVPSAPAKPARRAGLFMQNAARVFCRLIRMPASANCLHGSHDSPTRGRSP